MKKEVNKHKVRRFFKITGLVIVGLFVLGLVYEGISEYVDSKTLTPPGQMIEVNGHKLHLYCTGNSQNGSPTVILEAGGGDNYTTWTNVQPAVSKYTKVCSYDRAGLGFSEKSQDERTNDEVVSDLESLLKSAKVNGPYIMVGHSLGGFYTRLFTKRNFNEIKGLLQIDPTVEQQANLVEAPPSLLDNITLYLYYFAYKIGIPRMVMSIVPTAVGLDRVNMQNEISFTLKLYDLNNGIADGKGLFQNLDEIKAASNFGGLPVVVLSADQSLAMVVSQYGDSYKTVHSDLAKRLSNNSKHVLVNNSSHFIQHDQPQIVINNILELIKNQ